MKTRSPKTYPIANASIGFRPEFLDFKRGIHVGNLEENERITRILKLSLEAKFQQDFVTERWGRGVFWKWIGLLPRADRDAKPISSKVSFGCSKFFIIIEKEEKVFKCGLQVERGLAKAPRSASQFKLQSDWDWHRLVKGLRPGTPLDRELRRLILREDFMICTGSWEGERTYFSSENYPGATKLRRVLEIAPPNQWVGFQLYFAMTEAEVMGSTGVDLVESMLAVFAEVNPAMNATMDVELKG